MVLVAPFTARQQIDAPTDVEVFVGHSIERRIDVVGQVPTLEEPGRDEVRLQFGERVDEKLQLVPLILLLLVDGRHPQNTGCQAVGTGERQLDDAPGKLHFAQALFQNGQFMSLRLDGVAAPKKRPREQNEYQSDIDELASRQQLARLERPI